jgi:two-component system CheB/CheR fusion protein
VGIAASAAGLDALKDFLAAIPQATGMAWVVLLHPGPNHAAFDATLLGAVALPVRLVENGTRIAANHVYLCPGQQFLSVNAAKFALRDRACPAGSRVPVDHFLASLAGALGRDACAVVLSGLGQDTTLGLRAMKEGGGLVLVQDAGDPGMTDPAANTGLVDFILPAAEIPARIVEVMRYRHDLETAEHRHPPAEALAGRLTEVLEVLDTDKAASFRGYKPGTLVRRVLRRMALERTGSIDAYLGMLRESAEERARLSQDFLIGVTEFFRDPDCFDALRDRVLRPLIDAGKPELRIWVPGCSTGEEAYSIAILLDELIGDATSRPRIQIFGTDIDPNALRRARSGVFSKASLAGLPQARREACFTATANGWRIRADLRDLCAFAPHNLLQDPPFSRLDLISCRNVMIYLNAETQINLLPAFHYALNPHGYLMLGPSETVAGNEKYFDPLDRHARIFRCDDARDVGYGALSVPHAMTGRIGLTQAPAVWATRAQDAATEGTLEAEAEQLYRKRHADHLLPLLI